jgi:hypothetical protein
MMETTQDRDGVDDSGIDPLVYRRTRNPLAQPLVRALGVKVGHVLVEKTP